VIRNVTGAYCLDPPDTRAREVFKASSPVEDLVDPVVCQKPLHDLNLRRVTPELRTFLLEPQQGARHVARVLFERVSKMRLGEFGAVLSDTLINAGRVFEELAADRTHDGVAYFDHILRGLKRELPAFALDALAGTPVPDWVASRIRGIVVVHV
jgi:hypothetical protein